MRDRGNVLARKYLPAVRPIGIEYDDDHAELIGSAVLLGIGEKRFVLTAGHVADWASKGSLMLGGSDSFWMLPPLRTNASSGARSDDPLDIAFAELDRTTAEGLGAVLFLSPDDIDLDSHAATVPFYTIVGYPVVEQNLDVARKHFAPKATVFSNLALPPKQYARLWKGTFTPEANLAVRFDTHRVVTPDGIRALKNQQGLSGGGVWRFESLVQPEARDRLVGITIYAQTAGTRALVATRMNIFVAAILHDHPELKAHLLVSNTLSVSVRESPASSE